MEEARTRVCRDCGETKLWSEFPSKGRGFVSTRCKPCYKVYKVEQAKLPKKVKEVISDGYKKCPHCQEVLLFERFHVQKKYLPEDNRDRYYYICKECLKIKRRNSIPYAKDTKICVKCKEEKSVKEFNKNYNGYMDRCKLCEKIYREENYEAIKQRRLINRKPKTEKQKAKQRQWKRENKEKVASNARNRRARLYKLEGHHTADDIEKIYLEQLGRCPYCFSYLHEEGYHVDHKIPVARDELKPTNYAYNLQLLCVTCNTIKNAKTPEEFLAYIKIKHPERYERFLSIYYYPEAITNV